MSTIPGPDSWQDAGLVEPPVAQPVEAPAEAEEYLPLDPRPGHEETEDTGASPERDAPEAPGGAGATEPGAGSADPRGPGG
jgi:hypothetical protein